MESYADSFDAIVSNVEQVIQGKQDAIRLALLCMVAEGHLLIEDVPGVGKTSMAKALARSIDCTWHRIQFTPDLLPSDVTGVTVYSRANGTFEFRPGGIFANIVLADEINRGTPKTQSALLEVMAEQQVTVDSVTHDVPRPFLVMATQNPIEHEGTYPLPESQLDRFLLRVRMGYPDKAHEIEMLDLHGSGSAVDDLEPVADAADVEKMIAMAQAIHVAPVLKSYIVDLAAATRGHQGLALGMSPRASLSLQRAARAQAASAGREYVVPDDIKQLALPVLGHRMVLTPEAQLSGTTTADVLDEVLRLVPVPTGRVA